MPEYFDNIEDDLMTAHTDLLNMLEAFEIGATYESLRKQKPGFYIWDKRDVETSLLMFIENSAKLLTILRRQ